MPIEPTMSAPAQPVWAKPYLDQPMLQVRWEHGLGPSEPIAATTVIGPEYNSLDVANDAARAASIGATADWGPDGPFGTAVIMHHASVPYAYDVVQLNRSLSAPLSTTPAGYAPVEFERLQDISHFPGSRVMSVYSDGSAVHDSGSVVVR